MTTQSLIKDILITTTGVIALTLITLSPVLAYAEPTQPLPHFTSTYSTPAQNFTGKKYKIHGDWRVIQERGQTIIRFSGEFKTKNGRDLKVFLSPLPLAHVTDTTAMDDAVMLGKLKSNKGTQDYIIPDEITLAEFSSILIHCEAFSILWGGGRL